MLDGGSFLAGIVVGFAIAGCYLVGEALYSVQQMKRRKDAARE